MIRPQVHRLRGELRAVVTKKRFRNCPLQTNAAQHAHHVFSLQTLPYLDRQTLSGEHIHYRQSPKAPSIRQLIGHEVQTPNLIRSCRLASVPAIGRRAPAPPRLRAQRQALFLIQPIHQLLAHLPALALQQHPDLAVPITHSYLSDLANPQPKSGSRLASALVSKSRLDRKSTRLNSSHQIISYAVFCLKKKNHETKQHASDVVIVRHLTREWPGCDVQDSYLHDPGTPVSQIDRGEKYGPAGIGGARECE